MSNHYTKKDLIEAEKMMKELGYKEDTIYNHIKIMRAAMKSGNKYKHYYLADQLFENLAKKYLASKPPVA